MLTKNKNEINFNNIKTNNIEINDISHALSNQCRYNGHCSKFYSVAEHSVLVSKLVWQHTLDKKLSLSALLHDASEAYMGDIVTPLKQLLSDYLKIEQEFQTLIYRKFNLEEDHPSIVEHYDRQIVPIEMNQLFIGSNFYEDTTILRRISINCWKPEEANVKFLEQFYNLQLKGFQK